MSKRDAGMLSQKMCPLRLGCTALRVLMSNGFELIMGMEMEQERFSLCKEGKICVGYKYI